MDKDQETADNFTIRAKIVQN